MSRFNHKQHALESLRLGSLHNCCMLEIEWGVVLAQRITMKTVSVRFLMVICALVWVLPATAEIYKWRDKDGSIRYTDTPPPGYAKQEPIGGKPIAKPTGKPPLSPAAATAATPGKPAEASQPAAVADGKAEAEVESAIDAAEQRRRNAEVEKKNKQEKEAQAKLKAENCKAAQANMETYKQGGRVYRTNEKGEREYMDDADLKQGMAKAQDEINEYCN